jgi:hypothetical protein
VEEPKDRVEAQVASWRLLPSVNTATPPPASSSTSRILAAPSGNDPCCKGDSVRSAAAWGYPERFCRYRGHFSPPSDANWRIVKCSIRLNAISEPQS